MEPELKRHLEEIHALSRDTNRLMRSMRRQQLIGLFITVVFWVALIVAPLYFYQQYLQPLVAQYFSMLGTEPLGILGLPSSVDVQKLLDSFSAGQ